MLSSTFIDDFGMRKLPLTAAEDLLEIVMRATSAPAPCSLPILKCSALHLRFDAVNIFMRALILWEPCFPAIWNVALAA
jgi:hypothetical protein